jgi:hypothetical protein
LDETCDLYVRRLQVAIQDLMAQREVLIQTIETGYNALPPAIGSALDPLKAQTDEKANEAMILTNALLGILYGANCPALPLDHVQVLEDSRLIEAKKQLAFLLLHQKDFAALTAVLNTITSMNSSLVWYDEAGKAIQQQENTAFVRYLSLLKNALQQGRHII